MSEAKLKAQAVSAVLSGDIPLGVRMNNANAYLASLINRLNIWASNASKTGTPITEQTLAEAVAGFDNG